MKQLRDKPLLCESEGFELLGSCIETAPMSAHVAANLAKWWKTKFLNGYKQFTVVPTDCSDGRPSDTEELLGRHHHYSGGGGNEKDVSEDKSDSTPLKPPPTTTRRQLNFEEFECDVSVGGGVDTKGQERQEFSFTLYDFDGHGKITKDDIAGLVTTIYDTLGNTIKVPHYGSKTIKVKLTVSPDPRKKEAAAAAAAAAQDANANPPSADATSPPTNGGTPLRVKFKRDLNVTIRESRHPKRPHRRRRVPATKPEEKYVNSCSSSCRSGGSENNEECAADISEDDEDEDEEDILVERMLGKEFATRGGSTVNERRHRRYQQRQAGTRCRANTSPLVFQQRSKKRSSSLQREELLQIIQANMEKNNLSFQTSRKQCVDRDGLGDHRHSHHRHRHKPSHYEDSMAARVQLHYLANPRSTCYLDLAALNTSHKTSDHCAYEEDCRYDKLLGAVVCASAKHASNNFHQPCCGRHRSRSHDVADPFRYHMLDPDLGVPGTRHSYADGMSPYAYAGGKSPEDPPRGGKTPHFVLGHTSSPHHLKHRNREEDQARAMAQVVRWLEREFSSSLDNAKSSNVDGKVTAEGSPSKGQGATPSKDEPPNSPGASSAERHEHHHVHEHVHHHYHHYQETPVLV